MARYNTNVRYSTGARYNSASGAEPKTKSAAMIALSRYFEIPFNAKDISLAELLAFATDHLQRLVSNNPGAQFNTLITATTSALNVMGQCSSDDMTKMGLRKAAKQAKGAFREALPANIRKIHAKVAGEFGDPSPQLTSAFPAGREVYGSITDDQLEHRLQQLSASLTALAAPVTVALADAQGLLSTWIALYAASEASTGGKVASQEEKAKARAGLSRQLTINLLTIARLFVGEPEKAELYFKQHLLEDPASPEEPEPAPPVQPTP